MELKRIRELAGLSKLSEELTQQQANQNVVKNLQELIDNAVELRKQAKRVETDVTEAAKLDANPFQRQVSEMLSWLKRNDAGSYVKSNSYDEIKSTLAGFVTKLNVKKMTSQLANEYANYSWDFIQVSETWLSGFKRRNET